MRTPSLHPSASYRERVSQALSGATSTLAAQSRLRRLSIIAGLALTLFLAFYNLTRYPLTWFDEGSHLHVPKTLVRFGVYADYSSDGFRHYGPTIGVGPTVMLPIAAAFRFLGIGLGQARLVMVLYLLGTIGVFYWLARQLGGARLALVAGLVLVASRGTGLVEYGRQVLGEVPGMFFTLAGLSLWFMAWERAGWRRLIAVGLLLGLAMVTKQQYLLVLAPTLLAGWAFNLIYYRSAPQRVFLVPGLLAAACFIAWQAVLVVYLGPATVSENLAEFREFTAGAALVFSPVLMQRALGELLSWRVYLWALFPALAYGVRLALPRQREGHQWGILLVLVTWNLIWYVVASVSWIRYAFPALVVAALFVARFFHDLTDGLHWDMRTTWEMVRRGGRAALREVWRGALLAWLVAVISVSLGRVVWDIIAPPVNAPAAMAAYLDEHIPRTALIETWEPEMGFLTDHNYHFPPQILLNTAVKYIWQGGTPPAANYDFVQSARPNYILVGEFARWVQMYPADVLARGYRLVTTIGGYELYTAQR